MKIKICGLRRAEDIETAVGAGATSIGFVFAASPRRISPVEASALFAAVRAGVDKVAVFRRPEPALLREVLSIGVYVVQADANWDPSGLTVPFLPALSDGPDLAERVAAIEGLCLVDGPRGGGRGVLADLDRVGAVAAVRRLYLAGGLSPENVAEAIRRVRPWGVDVSSGVESAPGVKDPERIRAFIREAQRGNT